MRSLPPADLPANEIEPAPFAEGPLTATGKHALERDSVALARLAESLGETFERSAALLVSCTGRVYVVGDESVQSLGTRIARSLNRAGIAALWVNAREAHEGHASWACKRDLFLLISSGTACEELVRLAPQLRERQVRSVGVFLRSENLLARRCTACISCSELTGTGRSSVRPLEHHLDSLASALVEAVTVAKNIKYSAFDTQGNGQVLQRLLFKAGDLMRTQDDVRCVTTLSTWAEVLYQMRESPLHMVFVLSQAAKLIGVIGARELINTALLDPHTAVVEQIMRKGFPTIDVHTPVGKAMRLMKRELLEAVPVESEMGEFVGVLSLHDLML